MIQFSYTWWFTNDMSTTHCGTNIVRMRVDLLNDILRFDYVLRIFLLCRTNYFNFMAQVYFLLGLFRNSKNYQGFWTNHDGIQGSWLNNLSSLEVQKVTRGFGPTMMAYKASQTFGCWDNFSVQYFAWQISKTQVFFLCRFTPNKIQTCVEL